MSEEDWATYRVEYRPDQYQSVYVRYPLTDSPIEIPLSQIPPEEDLSTLSDVVPIESLGLNS